MYSMETSAMTEGDEMTCKYVEGGSNMNDTNDVAIERKMSKVRRAEANKRAKATDIKIERAFVAATAAWESGDDQAFDSFPE